MVKNFKILLIIGLFIFVGGNAQTHHSMLTLAGQDYYVDPADDLFARMESVSYYPTTGIKSAYNYLIRSMIDSGLWTETDMFQIRRAEVAAASLLDIKGTFSNATTVSSPIFNKNAYWTFNATTNYINTNYNPANGINFTQNDCGFIVKTTNTNPGNIYVFGTYTSSTARIHILTGTSGSNASCALNGGNTSYSSIVGSDQLTNKAGYWAAMRYRSDSITLFKDNAYIKKASTSASVNNLTVHEGHINGLTNFGNPQVQLIWMGGNLSTKQYNDFRYIMEEFFFLLDIQLAESVKLHGAEADGITDDFLAIQNLIDSTPLFSLKIGDSRIDTFLISQSLIIPSNKTVVIDGVIKIKDGSTTTITQNVDSLSSKITVASTVGFNVGEQIGFYDTRGPIEGGGIQTRRIGGAGIITNILGDTITIDGQAAYSMDTNYSPVLGHVQDVISIVDNASNVRIYGDGLINANRREQLDMSALYLVHRSQFGSGIKSFEVNGFRIWGRNRFEVLGGVAHGIAVDNHEERSSNIDYRRIYSHDAHNKNFHFYYCRKIFMDDIIANDSEYEDGIIFYTLNDSITMNNITCMNNRRGGIYFNSNSNIACNASNLFLAGNVEGDLLINSNNLNLTDVFISRYSTKKIDYSIKITSAYSYGDNINITNLSISGIELNTNGSVIGLFGDVDNININNMNMTNCIGLGIRSDVSGLGVDYPDNVIFDGGGIFNHTGTKTDIESGSDVTFTDFTGL